MPELLTINGNKRFVFSVSPTEDDPMMEERCILKYSDDSSEIVTVSEYLQARDVARLEGKTKGLLIVFFILLILAISYVIWYI